MVKVLKRMKRSINPRELLEIEFDNEMITARSTLEFRYVDTDDDKNHAAVSVNFTDEQVSELIETLQKYLTDRTLDIYPNKGN